jgi:hypothetical protein
MNWHRRLAAVFVMLALVGCVQGVTGPGQALYAPYSHNDRQERTETDGGGGM